MSRARRCLFLSATLIVALSACGPGRGTPPIDAELRASRSVTWQTPLGPGGAEVPPWPVLPRPDEASIGFSRLLGVLLVPASRELLFVGVQDNTQPPIDVDDLMDALVVSLRALPGAPGVSIDPTPAQIAHGLRARDLMNVRYVGGDERTVVGDASFEADRMMKCLSFAKDNISEREVTCSVSGFESELEVFSREPPGIPHSWHRFWIEQKKETPVEISDDGRMLLITAELVVGTEYMEAVGGELRSSKRPPVGPAKQFANHLTSHYDEYGREFPVYNRLRAFAQMTTLARALTDNTGSNAFDAARSALNVSTIVGRRDVRAVETAATTPAIVASKAATTFSGSVSLTGGVDLTPFPRYAPNAGTANAIERDVLRAVERDWGRAAWKIARSGETLVVMARPLANATTRMRQTDMTVGRLRFVRVSRDGRRGSIGGAWDPRLPELQFSADTVDVNDLGRMPRTAIVTTLDDEPVWLGQHARLEMPGQPPTRGFGDTEPPEQPQTPAVPESLRKKSPDSPRKKKNRRRLYIYGNVIVLVDGDVRFSDGDWPPRMEIPADASVTEFATEAPYRPLRIHTSEGAFEIAWNGNRLLGYRAGSGERIDVLYDGSNQIVGLRGSDGQAVDYLVDRVGWLHAAVDRSGNGVSYWRPGGDGPPTAVSGATPDAAGGRRGFGRIQIGPGIAAEILRQQVAELSTPATEFWGLHDKRAENGAVVIGAFVGGKTLAPTFDVERAIEALVDVEGGNGPASTQLRAEFFDPASSARAADVVIVDGPYLRNRFAKAFARIAPERTFWTAADPTLAARNLAAIRKARPGFRHVHVSEGLEESIDMSIQKLAATHRGSGDLVIVSGHNSITFAARIEQLVRSGEVKGKTVLLLSCGRGETGELDYVLRDGGAIQVIAFEQPINAAVLAPFLDELYRRLNSNKEPAAKVIRSIMDDVIKVLRARPGMNLNDDDLRVLEQQVRQIGRLRERSDSDLG